MRRINLVIFATWLAFGVISAQQDDRSLPWDIWLNPTTADFTEIQNEAEGWFEGKGTGKGTGFKQWKRWEYMMQNRLTADGKITNFNLRNFRAHKAYQESMPQDQLRSNGGFWNQLATDGYILGNSGYNPGIGRVGVIAFHPTSLTTIYAGTPGGGLWRTTNEGTSWTCLTNGLPRIGVSGIVVDPNNPNIIYILTGDGDGSDTYSIGVLRTTDGGTNWFNRGLSFDPASLVRGFKLAMKPGDPTTLFAVTTQGIYRTENSGVDWTLVRSGSFRDLEFKPGDPEVIYATTSNSFWRSESGGDSGTWFTSNTGLPSGETRAAIAVSANQPNWIYYLAGPGGPTGSFKGLYRSTNSGDTWGVRTTMPNILDSNLNGDNDCSDGCDQASYDLAMAIDPNDGGEVITGGVNMWRDEVNGGTSMSIVAHWRWSTVQANNLEYVHADIHELVFQDDNRLWCGSDGGIFLSTDDGVTWTDKTSAGTNNGLIATQFYRIAGTPANANIVIGGTQDNGSNRWNGGNDITHFDGADGMDCIVDYTNSNIQYHCRQRGGLRKSTNGGTTHSSIKPGNSNGAWVTPIRMDPQNNNEIWAGYRDTIYRSTNAGSSWTPFIPQFTGERFVEIWCAPSNSQVVYAATSNFFFRTGNNGGLWANRTGTLPVGTTNITGITTDVHNSNDVWVTLSGYVDGEKVYFSDNAGVTWTNVSGSLPNIPVNCIEYDSVETNDNAVYIGTDIGVFYRDVTLNDWVPFRNGLPTVEVFDLEVTGNGINKIRAGTHGRGLWESFLYTDCPDAFVLNPDNAPGNSVQGYRFYQASMFILSNRHLHGGDGSEVYYKAGDYVRLDEGFRAHAMDIFRAWLGPCGSGIPEAPLTMDPSMPDDVAMSVSDTAPPIQAFVEGEEGNTLRVLAPGEHVVNVGLFTRSGKEIERLKTGVLFDDETTLTLTHPDIGSGQYFIAVYDAEQGLSAMTPINLKQQ